MTVRTKAALLQQIVDTLEDGGRNTAVEVRAILTDIVDSLCAQAECDDLDRRVTALEEGGGGTPTAAQRILLISADENFSTAEVVAGPMDGQAIAIPPDAIPAGQRRYVAIGRPEADGDFGTVYFYAPGHRNEFNVLMGWVNVATPVAFQGGSWHILRTRVSQRDSADGFIVEAF